MLLIRNSKCLLPKWSALTSVYTSTVSKNLEITNHSPSASTQSGGLRFHSSPIHTTDKDNDEEGPGAGGRGSFGAVNYVQGQYRDKIREYFYFIDHQGFLYLDNARMKNFTSCFKDKKFLHFFYSRVRENETGRYLPEFPYISPCGRELNFIHGDDVPVVFTAIKDGTHLVWGNVDELSIPFDPSLIYMSVENGRIYHPYQKKYPFVGLIASKIGIEISNNFVFDDNKIPVAFKWAGKEHQLRGDCKELLEKIHAKNKPTNV